MIRFSYNLANNFFMDSFDYYTNSSCIHTYEIYIFTFHHDWGNLFNSINQQSHGKLCKKLCFIHQHHTTSNTYSSAHAYSPCSSKYSTNLFKNSSPPFTVSLSHTNAQCRLALVTATFILRASDKNPTSF